MPLYLSSPHSLGAIHFPLPRRSSAVVLIRKCNQSTSLLAAGYRRFQFSYRRPSRFSALCCRNEAAEVNYFQRLGSWLVSLGGDWWSLPSSVEADLKGTAGEEIVTAIVALRQIWDLLATDRLIVYSAFGSLTIAALSEITIPCVLTAAIFAAQSNNQVAFYGNVKLLGILCFISGICSGLRSGSFALADVILVKRVRETLYSTLIFQDVSFFDEETIGNLTSRLGADSQRLSYVIGKDLHLILRNILQGTGALISLLMLSWSLTLSTAVICSVLAAMFLVYGRFQKNAARLTQEFTACANEVAEDTLSQMRTVQIYGTEWMEFGRYKTWLERLASISFRESTAYGVWTSSFIILYRSTQVIAVFLGGMSVMTGQLSPEQVTKYILYCEWMIYATWRLVDSLSSLLQSFGASERIFQLMSLSHGSEYLTKGNKLQRLVGNIQFKDVSFCYPSRKKEPVLQDIDLSLQPNEVVAIVGPSGCGKSSLMNLLLRFYEPQQGQIYLDGFPLNELDIRWLREKIGYVGPGPYIFNTDIKSNISYGCSRDVSQDEIELAAKEAGAHDFISSLPDGYETVVHEGLLSGGQKQRLAIARVVLKNPEILILDEATSALDLESEHHIKGLIDRLRTDGRVRTTIVVAHRLKSIENLDKIVVMKGGRIVEMGTHLELVVKNGLYAGLVKLQTDALLTTGLTTSQQAVERCNN